MNDYIDDEEHFEDELAEQFINVNINTPPPINIVENSFLTKNIIDAEEKLLELSLLHGTVARALSEMLPHDAISNTPVGNALEKVISMTLDEEWEFAEQALLNEDGEHFSLMVKIVTDKESMKNISHDKQEKIVSECVKIILVEFIDKKISVAMNNAKTTSNPEQKNEFLKEYRDLGQQKRKLITKK